jgi:hypothetical protein
MNNLVFNTRAEELRTSIYAQSPDLSIKSLQLDNDDNLLVAGSLSIANSSLTVTGTVTVSEITNPVTIANASLTVAGTVTVAEITNPVTIANASLTVAGTVTVAEITNPVTIANASLTVAGTITVSEITNPVTIANVSLTTSIGGYLFTSDSVVNTPVTGTGVLFADTDISQVKTASMLLYNQGAVPITLSLQISPTTTDGDYIDDPSYSSVVLTANEKKYMAISSFAHYARLQYIMGGSTGTITAYYNAQT